MKAVTIVEAVKKEGNLISVSVKLQDPADIAIYRKFLESEPNADICPYCFQHQTIGDNDMVLRIDSPLANKTGLAVATPIMTCDDCGAKIELNMLEYSCLKSVVQFISSLQARYLQLKKGRAGNGKETAAR